MNEDHVDALELIAQNLHGIDPQSVRMTGLDRRGFFCEHEGTPSLFYTSFGTEISADELRVAMVKITKQARASGAH